MHPWRHPHGEHKCICTQEDTPLANICRMRAQERTLEANSGWVMASCSRSHSVIYNINTYIYMNISIMCLRIVYLYVCIQIHGWIYGVLHHPHMYPREDTLKRRTCICTREDTLLSEHMPYVGTRAHAQAPTGCVTRAPKRGHPQLTRTCWGPHMHP